MISRIMTTAAYKFTKTGPMRPFIIGTGTMSRSPTAITIEGERWYSQPVNDLPFPTVEYDYVKKAITKNDVIIIDVREPDEIKEHGKIPNSLNIPLGIVSETLSMSENSFQQTFNRPKPSENSELIFYCMIGKRSAKAQQSAINLGYKNAKNYLGSWTDWATKSK